MQIKTSSILLGLEDDFDLWIEDEIDERFGRPKEDLMKLVAWSGDADMWVNSDEKLGSNAPFVLYEPINFALVDIAEFFRTSRSSTLVNLPYSNKFQQRRSHSASPPRTPQPEVMLDKKRGAGSEI